MEDTQICSNCGWKRTGILTPMVVVTEASQSRSLMYVTPVSILARLIHLTNGLEDSGQLVRWKHWTREECTGVFDALTMKRVASENDESE